MNDSDGANTPTDRGRKPMAERQLTPDEIAALQGQGCTADDWSGVVTTAPVDTRRLRNVQFSGTVRLGAFSAVLVADDGVPRPSGLYDCSLHDCRVGDDTYIRNVGVMARYDVGARCIVESTQSIVTHGATSFGNGTMVSVVNESGGRAIPICDRLSAQAAYFMTMYRHDQPLVDSLVRLVHERCAQLCAERGTIGDGAWVRDSGVLTNVFVGEHARIRGALRLEECTLTGSVQHAACVGEGVIARQVVALEGARIDGAARIERCLVGQGVHLGKGFSADDCMFFANSEGYNGEMCSVFAGPYTVSHHRSTLLIAGLFSFFNAGSATNQSNHMYKLGPVHAGVMERGCKTGSGAYLLWPSRAGAFNVVIGRHYAHFDSSELPFSLVREQDGHSYVLPGLALLGCGLWRDQRKWLTRDRRKAERLLDSVCSDVLTPVTVGAIERALNLLETLKAKAREHRDFVVWKGLRVNVRSLDSYARYYRLALDVYLGEKTVARLQSLPSDARFDSVCQRLKPDAATGEGDWVDVAGWVTPRSALEELLSQVRGGAVAGIDDVTKRVGDIADEHERHEWTWCLGLAHRVYGMDLRSVDRDVLAALGHRYRRAAAELSAMVELDASKEFGGPSLLGYGLDGDAAVAERDFVAVRGEPERHPFLVELHELAARAEAGAELIERMAASADAFLSPGAPSG
ncbi:MAG: DUF4954 family protein [Chitinivibrionales bacterium]|nr:DUF4954 family protein [Chitinivibrionales bacterium]